MNPLPSAFVRLAAAAVLFVASAGFAAGPEKALSGVLEAIEANRLELATQRVEALLAAHPNFRLAHLIRGDLLLARARPLETFGNVPKTVPREKVEDLRAEALLRLRAFRDRPNAERVPRYILQMHADQKYALVVDSRRSRLYVFENAGGRPQFIADYYVSLGKNGVDKTRASDGCIVLANADLEAVGSTVQIGLTPVIIADEIEWTDADSLDTERKGLADAFESWRADWESRDAARYLGHYAARVSSGDQDYRSSNLANTMRKRQYWFKDDGRWRILYEGGV